MATCCVIRQVWVQSLLATPIVLHAVRAVRAVRALRALRAFRTWWPSGRTVLETCPAWGTLASVRACTSSPCIFAALRLCNRASRQVCGSAVMRRCGNVAGVGATMRRPLCAP